MDELTHERLLSLLVYEPSTGVFRWKVHASSTRPMGSIAGSSEKRGYVQIRIDRRLYRAHRLAVFYVTGEWPPHSVDHKNVDKSDGRWDNLRLADKQGNSANTPATKRNVLGVKGVSVVPSGRFRALISANKRSIYLGTYDTAEQASEAYERAAKQHFGEFARAA